jgi:aldose 1-epimerase
MQTPLSEPERNNAIHGLVRWSAWELVAAGPDHLTAAFRLHPQPGWPWTVDFTNDFRLSADGLTVTTKATNASAEACPIGFGWHPYLAATTGEGLIDGDELRLPAATAYEADERGLPTGRRPVAGTDLDFRSARSIGGHQLDTAFTDLERDEHDQARIDLAGPGVGRTVMWVGLEYTHLMVYTGDTLGDIGRRRQAVAVEPMTCAPDALRSGDGLRTLQPGESLSASWGLRSEAPSAGAP